MSSRAVVVTTISAPNQALRSLADGCAERGFAFVVAGDTKTPAGFALPYGDYLSLAEQRRRFPALCAVLPERHYARKNTAYLAAVAGGAGEIQETDDDNLPLDSFWDTHERPISADRACANLPWLNVYALFTDEAVWPRGFPL